MTGRTPGRLAPAIDEAVSAFGAPRRPGPFPSAAADPDAARDRPQPGRDDARWLAAICALAERQPEQARTQAHAAVVFAALAAQPSSAPPSRSAAGVAIAEPGAAFRRSGTAHIQPATGPPRLTGTKLTLTEPDTPLVLVTATADGEPRCFLVAPGRGDIAVLTAHGGTSAQRIRTLTLRNTPAKPVGTAALVRTVTGQLRGADSAVTTGLVRAAALAAVAEADATSGRSALGKTLLTDVAVDMCLEHEAMTAMLIGQVQPRAQQSDDVQHLLVALTRYWIGRRALLIAAEALQRLGPEWPALNTEAAALLDDGIESAASAGALDNACMDVDDVLRTSPDVLDGYFEIVETALGANRILDDLVRHMRRDLLSPRVGLHGVRAITSRLAVAFQAACVARVCPAPIEETFVRNRLAPKTAVPLGSASGGKAHQLLLTRMTGR